VVTISKDESAPRPPKVSEIRDAAERRQVTVMFCDLVGSTALSARMDPEDLREVISAYQKCVAETVGRFGGFVAKYMGDGVLVYFGYPQAHEDDAERAVRAGLDLIQAVGGLKSSAPLQTRVGIATGLVVVGDLIGRPLSIVLMGLRIAEIHKHPIAHVLRYEPAEALHSLGNTALVRTNDLTQVVRVHTGGERRRTHEVREQRSDLAGRCAGARHCGRDAEPRRTLAGPAQQRLDCRKHPEAPGKPVRA
jgi:Adenylate and Guanylate cyclase catalytic domain